jgi:transposase InsO family protein
MGLTRQAYYKRLGVMRKERFQIEIVLDLVANQRKTLPRVGGKKLYYLLQDDFERLDYKLGRDSLFKILREYDLLIKRRKSYTKTTNSFHRFYVYKNLILELKIERPNQVFVADITYIRVGRSFMYLSLITDLCSRMIVGWNLSESLEASGCLSALKMALAMVSEPSSLIHHSDRGVQYCCSEYTGLLIANGISISMAQQGNPYENAHAERVNGILKEEFYLSATFETPTFARRAVAQAISAYNNIRPHLSLGMLTPAAVYFNHIRQQDSRDFSPLQGAGLGAVACQI